MLYVLIDKHDAPMDDLQQLASELTMLPLVLLRDTSHGLTST